MKTCPTAGNARRVVRAARMQTIEWVNCAELANDFADTNSLLAATFPSTSKVIRGWQTQSAHERGPPSTSTPLEHCRFPTSDRQSFTKASRQVWRDRCHFERFWWRVGKETEGFVKRNDEGGNGGKQSPSHVRHINAESCNREAAKEWRRTQQHVDGFDGHKEWDQQIR